MSIPAHSSCIFAQNISPLPLRGYGTYWWRIYLDDELAEAWYGHPSPDQAEAVAEALRTAREFAPDPHRPFLFQVRGGSPKTGPPKPPSQKRDLSELAVAERAAAKLFEKFSDFEKCGARPEQRTLVLHFDFPEKAYRSYQETLARETGWAVEVSPKGNHQAVQRAAREALPLTWDIAKVSIFQQEPRVRVRVRPGCEPPEEVLGRARERFLDETGKHLDVELLEPPAPPQNLFDERGRMEQNAAYQRIRTALAEQGVALLSFSRKGDPPYLELGLISPVVAARQAELLARLSAELGWELRLREGANQQALVTRARQLLPPAWRTEPAFLAAERCLRFATLATPDPAELEPLASQLEAETGFRLVLQTPRP